METLLVSLFVGYCIWFVAYFLWEERQPWRSVSQEDIPPQARVDDIPDIVGKSSFRMNPPMPTATTPMPNAATSSKEEEISEEDVTFAPETEGPDFVKIPDDELDEVFRDFRTEGSMEDGDSDESLPVMNASGNSFEEISEALLTAREPRTVKEAEVRAGEVFFGLNGTEMFERIKERFSSIDGRITELMDAYLDGNPVGYAAKEGAVISDDMKNFDIRDFA